MDCVILAGGKNTRLQGIVPAYHKPLLVVNGETLIARLVKQALTLCSKGNKIVVVVSPYNCQAIMEIVETVIKDSTDVHVVYLCQHPNNEFADIFASALAFFGRSEKALVLCGDNYVSGESWDAFLKHAVTGIYPIATWSSPSPELTERFAKFNPASGFLVTSVSGDYVKCKDGLFRCWLGPAVIRPDLTLTRLKRQERRDIIADALSPGGEDKVFFPVELNVQDIGTPEALLCA